MFSGIIAAVGKIAATEPRSGGIRLTIEAGQLGLEDVKVGDSIAVDGCCLTATQIADGAFSADVSPETLRCTRGFPAGGEVNLEKSLRPSDRLGGHLVTGHVDGVGEVTRFEPAGDSRLLAIRTPHELAKYIARKGSIAVSGVSLTVNEVTGDEFAVNVIPHTLEATNLKRLGPGALVNLEIDLIARYVERLFAASSSA